MENNNFLEDLANMEKVVEIFEMLGGQQESRISNLVTPYRRLVFQFDCVVKEPSNQTKVPHRVFVFKDAIILAKFKDPSLSSMESQKKQKKSFINPKATNNSNSEERIKKKWSFGSSSSSNKRNSSSMPPTWLELRFSLSHFLPLDSCTVKYTKHTDVDTNAEYFGCSLSHVSRAWQDGGNGKDKQVITRVSRLDLLLGDKDAAHAHVRQLNCLIDAVKEGEEEKPNELSKQRSWVKNKPKSQANLLKASGERERSDAGSDVEEDDKDAVALSLKDIENRYKVDFSQQPSPQKIANFRVEFQDGQMGFALTSAEGIGVIVSKVASGGFAELGGCCIGDRLAAVNGIEVDLNTSWVKAVEIIKVAGRPLLLDFVRNTSLSDQVEEEEVAMEKKEPGKRKWHSKRNAHGQAGIISLNELERIYVETRGEEEEEVKKKDSGLLVEPMHVSARKLLEALSVEAEFEEERQIFLALKEVLETEADYVTDLRALINDYVLPLRRCMRRKRCRDKEDGTLMCEHSLLRSMCDKESSESAPLISGEDVRIIFSNVETLVKVNHELLTAFSVGIKDKIPSERTYEDQELNNYLITCVAVFCVAIEKITPFFSMYALYCHQYAQATERLHTLRNEDDEVDKFLREREAKSTQTSLRSLLIKPVQRICRYPLLFQDLVKRSKLVESVLPREKFSTAKQAELDSFLDELRRVAEVTEKIAEGVNKKVEEKDSSGMMMSAFQELSEEKDMDRVKRELLAPHRKFVLSDSNVFFKSQSDAEPQQGKVYVFSDLVLLAVPVVRERAKSSLNESDRKNSRARSLSRLLPGRSMQSMSIGEASIGNNSNAGAFKLVHWVDLNNASVKPLLDETVGFGFSIKHVVTARSEEPGMKEKKKSWKLGMGGSSASLPPASNAKVVTQIDKVEIWTERKDVTSRMIEAVEEKVNLIKYQKEIAAIGAKKFGPQLKTRNWTMKKKKSSASGGDALEEGESKVDRTLDELSEKYGKKR